GGIIDDLVTSDQSVAEIDVLARRQRLVEAPDLLPCRLANEKILRREPLYGAEAAATMPMQGPGTLDPRRAGRNAGRGADRPDAWVDEVRAALLEPVRCDDAVGVHECQRIPPGQAGSQ